MKGNRNLICKISFQLSNILDIGDHVRFHTKTPSFSLNSVYSELSLHVIYNIMAFPLGSVGQHYYPYVRHV